MFVKSVVALNTVCLHVEIKKKCVQRRFFSDIDCYLLAMLPACQNNFHLLIYNPTWSKDKVQSKTLNENPCFQIVSLWGRAGKHSNLILHRGALLRALL